MLRRLGLGAGQQDPEPGLVGVAGPDLLARDHPLVAVERRPGCVSDARSRAGAGLAEQLAPDLLAGQQREQVPLLLLLGAGVDGGSGPAQPMPMVFSGRRTPARRSSSSTTSCGRDRPRAPRAPASAGRPGPVSASWRPVGDGWAASQSRIRGPHRVVGGGRCEVHGLSVGCPIGRDAAGSAPATRPAGRVHGSSPVRGRGDRREPVELRGRVGGGGRRAARRPRSGPRATAPSPGRSSTGGPTTWAGGCSGPGWRRTGQGGALPLQLPRVPRVHLRRLQGRTGPDQHQLPLRRRRAGVPVGERRLPSPWCSTGCSSTGSRGSATGCPACGRWLWVDDGTGHCPAWATPYEEAAETTGRAGTDGQTRVRAPWGRSPDDLHMLYTGGTTGMPKGVMWRQDDLFARLNGGGFRRYPLEGGIDGRAGRGRPGADRA